VLEEKYRGHLLSMADKIKFKYRTVDGWMQYAFAADGSLW
jgi:hypothetical protein